MKAWPVWRSMLFVPAHVDKFVANAHTRNADACILDLEDSVPIPKKAEARSALAAAAAVVSQSGAAVLARINGEPTMAEQDLRAAVIPEIRALMVPKVERAEDVRSLDARIGTIERGCGMEIGHTLLIAQIESVHGLSRMDEIAASSPRLMGLILGSEDFSISAGMEPTPETLYGPNQQLVFACRRTGILPFGFPGSISVFRNEGLLRQLIGRARDMGFVGSYAIHPNQVALMNELFSPSAKAVADAEELLAAGEAALAKGRGAFEFQGRMVDPPVVARAREIIRRHAALTASHASPKVEKL
jgi:citrate lyase subunit beta / citryl-CoA lyase